MVSVVELDLPPYARRTFCATSVMPKGLIHSAQQRSRLRTTFLDHLYGVLLQQGFAWTQDMSGYWDPPYPPGNCAEACAMVRLHHYCVTTLHSPDDIQALNIISMTSCSPRTLEFEPACKTCTRFFDGCVFPTLPPYHREGAPRLGHTPETRSPTNRPLLAALKLAIPVHPPPPA